MNDNEKRKSITTTHSKIFNYWKNKYITKDSKVHIEGSVPYNEAIAVVEDWGEPSCWCCGMLCADVFNNPKYGDYFDVKIDKIYNLKEVKSNLMRCHIIPDCLGGEDSPKNLFLLCPSCHRDSPDCIDKTFFFKFIYEERKSGGRFIRINKKIKDELNKIGLYFALWEDSSVDNLSIMAPHGGAIAESTIVFSSVYKCILEYKKMSNMTVKDLKQYINSKNYEFKNFLNFLDESTDDKKAEPYIDIINKLIQAATNPASHNDLDNIIGVLPSLNNYNVAKLVAEKYKINNF